jgi:hypothetical protein
MKKIIIITAVILLYACKQKEETKIIPVNMTDTIITQKEETTANHLNEQIGDTIIMLVEDKKDNYTAIGQIDSLHPRIYIKFANKTPANLKAVISTMEGDGNIRFNQIIFPDKTADGPFNKEVEQQLNIIGEYTLIVGHSLMADGRYEGKFKVNLHLGK